MCSATASSGRDSNVRARVRESCSAFIRQSEKTSGIKAKYVLIEETKLEECSQCLQDLSDQMRKD
eukprot:487530-Pleurochrysis_carterae.AAC.4